MANPYLKTFVPVSGTRKYRDIDLSMKKHPISKDILVKEDEDAIKQAITTLVMLNFYDKPFHPSIGGDIYKLLFENFDLPGTKEQLIRIISDLIRIYEPRVELKKIDVDVQSDLNRVVVSIYFQILNTLLPVKLDLFLKVSR